MKTDREKLEIARDILVCLAAAAFVIDHIVLVALCLSELIF